MKGTRLFFVINLISFLILGCSRGEKAKEEDISSKQISSSTVTTEDDSEQKVLTFSLSGTEEGIKKWDIEGESADVLSSDVVELSNIIGKTYTEDNVITITADKGKFDKKSNNMELKENVVVTTEDGAELNTEHLNWNAQKEFVWTKDFVQVQRDDIKATGYGILGEPNLEKVEFEKDVKVNIDPSTIITCNGSLKINYKESIAYLNDNVQVVDKNGEVIADKARVYFEQKEKKITKVIAEGNVRIKRDDNVTYSDKAVYYADEMKVILTGKPKFVIYSTNKEEKNAVNTH